MILSRVNAAPSRCREIVEKKAHMVEGIGQGTKGCPAAPPEDESPDEHIGQDDSLGPGELVGQERRTPYRRRKEELDLCWGKGEGKPIGAEEPPFRDQCHEEQRSSDPDGS